MQENRVHQREHGHAHSDAERQAALDHSCGPRVSPNANQGMLEVPGQSVKPVQSPGLTALLLDLGNAAQSYPCESPGFARPHSGSSMLLRKSVQMELQLCIEILLHEFTPE